MIPSVMKMKETYCLRYDWAPMQLVCISMIIRNDDQVFFGGGES